MSVHDPLGGYPPTSKSIDDQGLPAFIVVPRELTPEAAIRRAHVDKGLSVLLVGLTLYEWYNHDWAWSALIVMGIIAFIAYRAISLAVDRLLRKGTRIVLTRDFISIKLDGEEWMHLPYSSVSGFTMRVHEKAPDEQLQLEYDMQKASLRQRAFRKRIYYGDAFHLSAILLGQQTNLLTVVGVTEARAIVERMQLCFRLLAPWSQGIQVDQDALNIT